MTSEGNYGRLDRILHRVAFRTGIAQEAMADLEATIHRRTLDAVSLEAPVFISGLPRAGTTILLNLLWATGRFASHTYRDVPFVLCPMLWDRFARRFTAESTLRERAHGDGLMVSEESPEAFEEMIWKHFWPKHYRGDRILPWGASDQNAEFNEFFELHIRKIIALRGRDRPLARRYVSKNNVNIARLATLPGPLGAGLLLVPFREPIQHAASLLKQHRRFLQIQAEDDFIRRYMSGIGHHDFGMDVRPIDFQGWMSSASDPDTLEFWLRYWVAAYGYVLEHQRPEILLVSYARLTSAPETALRTVADAVGVPQEVLVPRSGELHPPRSHPVDVDAVQRSLIREAEEIFEQLDRQAAV